MDQTPNRNGEADEAHPKPLFGPIERLTFTESLDPQKFAKAAEATSKELLSGLLRVTFDGATVTLNTVRLLQSQVELIVSASRNGQELIRSGTATVPRHGASRLLLPTVTDAKTGKAIELMKEVPGARRMAQLTALSSTVIGAAHIIASADIAKKLKIIDGKLDILLAYRRVDQTAALERIYTTAKELAHMAPNDTTRLELWRLRNDLRQLRSTWRRELQLHLTRIEEPSNAGWVERQFNSAISIVIDREAEQHRRIHNKISEGELQLSLMEYALRLDQVIAVGSDTVPAFERTLADELIEIRAVAELLQTKAAYITKQSKGLLVQPMLSGIRNMIEHYEALLPDSLASD